MMPHLIKHRILKFKRERGEEEEEEEEEEHKREWRESHFKKQNY